MRELRLRWIGHRMRAEAGVEVGSGLSHPDAHAIAYDAEHRLAHAIPRLDAASVRVAPAAVPGTPGPA